MAIITPELTESVSNTTTSTQRRVVSALWLFVILCYLYCDVLNLHYAPDLAALIEGRIEGGIELTQGFLLGSAVLMTIPIGMTLVSRIAARPIARWSTVVAGTVMTVAQVASLFVGNATLHYVYFSVIEIATTAFLALYAGLRWRASAPRRSDAAA
jgi:hypothetical protein